MLDPTRLIATIIFVAAMAFTLWAAFGVSLFMFPSLFVYALSSCSSSSSSVG
jgi:hypothetical protein